MKVISRFPVRNKVRVDQPWPVKKGSFSLILERDGDLVEAVCIVQEGVSTAHASKIQKSDDPSSPQVATIIVGAGIYHLAAERVVREWQTLLSSFILFDIDFDTHAIEYVAETEDEKSNIDLSNFKVTYDAVVSRKHQYEHVARAFLARDHAVDHLEAAAHYRDAEIAHRAGRYIDAYNGFFLFLETRYCAGKTQKKEQLKRLLAAEAYVSALAECSESFTSQFRDASNQLSAVSTQPVSLEEITEQIIGLRGLLRHHNLNSPHRWDPNNTKKYELETRFLGAICGSILLNELFMRTYDDDIVEEFAAAAKEMGVSTEVMANFVLCDPVGVQKLKLSYPVPDMSVELAFSAATKSLQALLQKQLSDRVVQIHGQLERRRVQVFDLTLGPKLHQSNQAIQLTPSIVGSSCVAIIEYRRDGLPRSGQFKIPFAAGFLHRLSAWQTGLNALNLFNYETPDAELLAMTVRLGSDHVEVFRYALGATIGR